MIFPEYSKYFSDKFAKPVLKAIKKYGMINSGDKIAVALSGGKDSISLLYVLKWLTMFSYLKFELLAVHIETYRIGETNLLKKYCNFLKIPLLIGEIHKDKEIPKNSICSVCARLKRGAMKSICEKENIASIAFGHHATDAAETLFMNMLINKKLGSFSPLVRVSNSQTQIIRPMIYLTEEEIIRLHTTKNLPIATSPCPYESKNIRATYKKVLPNLEKTLNIKDSAKNIVAALENIDENNLYSIEMLKSSAKSWRSEHNNQ